MAPELRSSRSGPTHVHTERQRIHNLSPVTISQRAPARSLCILGFGTRCRLKLPIWFDQRYRTNMGLHKISQVSCDVGGSWHVSAGLKPAKISARIADVAQNLKTPAHNTLSRHRRTSTDAKFKPHTAQLPHRARSMTNNYMNVRVQLHHGQERAPPLEQQKFTSTNTTQTLQVCRPLRENHASVHS
jgi:hypothetical protein